MSEGVFAGDLGGDAQQGRAGRRGSLPSSRIFNVLRHGSIGERLARSSYVACTYYVLYNSMINQLFVVANKQVAKHVTWSEYEARRWDSLPHFCPGT